MSPDSGRRAVAELDTDLELALILAAVGLAMVFLARTRISTVRRAVITAGAARENAQETASELRSRLDGALDQLHATCRERDELRQQLEDLTDPADPDSET